MPLDQTLQAAMVNASRAWTYGQTRCMPFVQWQTSVSIARTVSSSQEQAVILPRAVLRGCEVGGGIALGGLETGVAQDHRCPPALSLLHEPLQGGIRHMRPMCCGLRPSRLEWMSSIPEVSITPSTVGAARKVRVQSWCVVKRPKSRVALEEGWDNTGRRVARHPPSHGTPSSPRLSQGMQHPQVPPSLGQEGVPGVWAGRGAAIDVGEQSDNHVLCGHAALLSGAGCHADRSLKIYKDYSKKMGTLSL